MNLRHLPRIAAVLATSGLAIAGATAANAEPIPPGGNAQVEVGVEIEAFGELYMEVAPGAISLTEDGSTDDARNFTGALPEVTVTDTRGAAEVAPGAFWYVLGQASDLVSESDTIPAENLGWTPTIIDDDGNEGITPGEPVLPTDPGLASGEDLLFWDVSDEHVAGVYTAGADLLLTTAPDVAGGSYSGTITLSLFEDIAG